MPLIQFLFASQGSVTLTEAGGCSVRSGSHGRCRRRRRRRAKQPQTALLNCKMHCINFYVLRPGQHILGKERNCVSRGAAFNRSHSRRIKTYKNQFQPQSPYNAPILRIREGTSPPAKGSQIAAHCQRCCVPPGAAAQCLNQNCCIVKVF